MEWKSTIAPYLYYKMKIQNDKKLSFNKIIISVFNIQNLSQGVYPMH